jgi:hypothetical protein
MWFQVFLADATKPSLQLCIFELVFQCGDMAATNNLDKKKSSRLGLGYVTSYTKERK